MKTDKKLITVTQEELNTYLSLIDPENMNKTTQLPDNYISLFWQAFELAWINTPAILVSSRIDYKRHLYTDTTYQCYVKLNQVRHLKNSTWYDQTLYVTSDAFLEAKMQMRLKLNRESS